MYMWCGAQSWQLAGHRNPRDGIFWKLAPGGRLGDHEAAGGWGQSAGKKTAVPKIDTARRA